MASYIFVNRNGISWLKDFEIDSVIVVIVIWWSPVLILLSCSWRQLSVGYSILV